MTDDDRGMPREIIVTPRDWRGLPKHVRSVLGSALAVRLDPTRTGLAIGSAVGLGLPAIHLATTLLPQKPSGWIIFTIQLVVALLMGPAISQFFLNAGRGTWRDREANGLCLRFGICPTCGFVLDGLTPAPDAYVVCPECEAAWQARRIGPALLDHSANPKPPGLDPKLLRPSPRVLPVRLIDARGKPCRAAPILRFGSQRPDYRVAFSHAVNLARPQRTPAWLWGPLTLLILGLLGVVLATGLHGTSRWPAVYGVLMFVCLAIAGIGASCLKLRAMPHVHRTRIVKAFTSWRICPSCGVDLLARPTEADGCTLCDHCGSAWRSTGSLSIPCTRCHYDLSALVPTETGHVMCPECAEPAWIARDQRSSALLGQ